ncbi:MAG: LacI family transcriptional regulator [Clostridiales bacterium]|nr:LacI family transcriptional regulator [Clostridiales bacterium]
MNIYDISRKAGVSIATVSRVINGNSNVSEKTKEKVLKVIDECGYTPNAFARGLGLNSMNTVGIMCADSSDPFLASAIYFLERQLRQNNYDALLCCTGYEVDVREKYLNLLLSKRTDAIILVGSNFVEANNENNQYIRDASKKVPIIIVNGALDGENIFSALCDDYRAVYDAVKALQESGCNKILYLYNSKSYSGNKKLSGYLSAMDIDPSVDPDQLDYVQHFNGNIIEVRDHLTSLRKNGLEFDAIVTADDNLAIGAIKYAKLNHISIPDELSIIGYNNSIISECSDPELTSIDNKLEAVCNNCISTLMGALNGQEVPLKTVFSAEIVKRGTTRF